MNLIWAPQAWNDYLFWQDIDKKTHKRINNLIRAIQESPYEGKGTPLPLKHALNDLWSRRIDKDNRLVYKVTSDSIVILLCRYHFHSKP